MPLRRQNEIHAPGGRGGLRHGGELRGGRFLGKRHATRGFDGFHARRAVRARAGQDYPDGPASALVGHGPQEPVDGHVRSRRLRTWGHPKRAVCDSQIDVCRYDVYVVGFHRHAIGRLTDRHGRGLRKNLGQPALVPGIEMLNEHDSQACIGGQFGEQKLEDLQPSRGGPNASHWDDRPGCPVVFGRFGGEGVPSVRFRSRPDNSGRGLLVHSYLLSLEPANLAISRPQNSLVIADVHRDNEWFSRPGSKMQELHLKCGICRGISLPI